MGILSEAPQGFSKAVSLLNSLPQGTLAEMSQDVIAFLQYQVGFINIEHHQLALDSLGLSSKPDAQMCINALTFLFRAAASAGLSADALQAELKSSLEWSEGVMAALKHVWKEEGPKLISMPKESLSIGQIVSMDWKLGAAMSSSSCKSFNCPYVTLQMRVAESDGTIKQHTLEMTIPQFQNFSAQLKEMANTLDTAA